MDTKSSFFFFCIKHTVLDFNSFNIVFKSYIPQFPHKPSDRPVDSFPSGNPTSKGIMALGALWSDFCAKQIFLNIKQKWKIWEKMKLS